MTFKDGDKCFELKFDAISFLAYIASLGRNFDVTYRNGVVDFPDDKVFDAILYGVAVFGCSREEHPNKNLVFLMTYYLNQGDRMKKRIKEIVNGRGSLHDDFLDAMKFPNSMRYPF